MRSPRTTGAGSRVAAAALAAVLALGGAGCVVTTDAAPARTDPAVSLGQLDELTVARPGSMRGYSRDKFPHWADAGPNCDVRDTVLRRDGDDVQVDGCNVVGGRWFSEYDGSVLDEPSQVDVDHMVPLANAWRSGASEWSRERRKDFANDLDRPQLFAVSRTSNRAKGDQDPSQWKPPATEYWCVYAQDWIAVKHYWGLTVTSAEKTALGKMLETCEWPSSSTSALTSSRRPAA